MFEPYGQGGCSPSPLHYPSFPEAKEKGLPLQGGWAQWGGGSAGRSSGQHPSPRPRGPSPTFRSRCGCVIISAPLASVDYAACLLHLQQYPESPLSSEFLCILSHLVSLFYFMEFPWTSSSGNTLPLLMPYFIQKFGQRLVKCQSQTQALPVSPFWG